MSKHAPIEFELKPKELRAMGFEYDKDECVEFIEKTPHVSKCVNMHKSLVRMLKKLAHENYLGAQQEWHREIFELLAKEEGE